MIEFSKFKIIECTAAELMSAFGTSVCLCDYCGKPQLGDDLGYYIAVLNKWYCKDCFNEFKKWAKWYPEMLPTKTATLTEPVNCSTSNPHNNGRKNHPRIYALHVECRHSRRVHQYL